MKKRVFAVLVCVMLCMSVSALAAVPSKTTQDMASVVEVETTTEVTVDEGFIIEIIEEQEYSTTELETIAAFIQPDPDAGEESEPDRRAAAGGL